MNTSSLKNKVASAIVAISAIHLLKVFMSLESYSIEYLPWYVLIHLCFIVGALAMMWIDKYTTHRSS